jgi:hypothetical protein
MAQRMAVAASSEWRWGSGDRVWEDLFRSESTQTMCPLSQNLGVRIRIHGQKLAQSDKRKVPLQTMTRRLIHLVRL